MKKTGQRKNRIVIIPVTVILTLSLIAGIFFANDRSVEARATLPGIEKIVMDNGITAPYVILEVLPQKSEARLGYLVGGEEPADASAKAISDMPSKEERKARLSDIEPTVPEDLSRAVTFVSGYEETVEGTNSFSVRGIFKQVEAGKGDYNRASADDIYEICDTPEKTQEAIKAGKTLYRKYVSYRTENGEGSFALTVQKYDESVKMPVPAVNWDETLTDCYNYQYFVAQSIADDSFSNAADGDLIYVGTSGGDTLQYYGKITHAEAESLQDGQGNETPPESETDTTEETTEAESTTESDQEESSTTTETPKETVSEPEADMEEDEASNNSAARFVKALALNDKSYLEIRDGNVLLTELEPDFYEKCYIVHEGQGSDVGSELYCLTDVDDSYGPYQVQTAFQKVAMDDNDTYNQIDPEKDGIFYILKDNASEYTYAGDGQGEYVFVADMTCDPAVDSFSYNNGFKNAEWFKKNVFDLDEEQCAGMVIDVVPVTVEELKAYPLENADLIYFAGGAYSEDLDNTTAAAIVKKAVNEYFPVILNRSVYTEAIGDSNFQKMAACLMKEKLPAAGSFDSSLTEEGWTALTIESLQSAMKKPDTDGTMNYVNQTVYVNDDTQNPLVTDDFCSDFSGSSQKVAYGFQDVADEIESENFYREVAGQTLMDKTVSKATAIRYIINYGNKRVVVKSKVTILDLEPYDASEYTEDELRKNIVVDGQRKSYNAMNSTRNTLTKDWFIKNIGTQFEDDTDAVTVETMGTKEFVGKLDDLNATYDMIYIGMDTAIMNTGLRYKDSYRPTKTENTVYNDSSMNGLVYTHVGDLISDNDSMMPNRSFRLSGNDITYDKLQELISYVKAGYTVLLSDGFLNNNLTINTTKVDRSSNMYTFLDTVMAKKDGQYLYYGKNVNIRKNLETGTNVDSVRETFVKYLNISKLEINCTQKPVSYNPENGSQTGQQYITADSNGSYPLDFEFTLSNDAAVELANTTYNCSLYIDLDADGRFEAEEKQKGITVTRKDGDSWTDTSLIDDAYHLSIGYQYHVSKNVPEGYTGLVSWKLIFSENPSSGATQEEKETIPTIRKEISGFSAVPSPATVPTIRVLQIYSSDRSLEGSTLNLSDSGMQALYSQVKDFNIVVDTISAADYIRKTNFQGDTYFNYLCGYNMVVMGFADAYRIDVGSDSKYEQQYRDGILAIRQYVLSGRSILFTHDLNSPALEHFDTWGYYANRYLRDVQGMDRYNDIASYNTIPNDSKYQYNSRFDTAVLKGSNQEKAAFADSTIVDHLVGQDSKYGETSRYVTYNYALHEDINGKRFDNTEISMINEGQITQYPFRIPQTMNVAHTHPQYFQLNLDTDSRDDIDNDDIVVWYTISGLNTGAYDDFFKANKNDVRNNYYIYTKGNVTYTGSGDSNITADMELERKLFVNTLIASYNSGIHAPTAIYKENNWDASATITNRYLPYDPDVNEGAGSYLESDGVVVNFKTINNNLLDNTAPIYAKYYVAVSDASQATVVIGNKKLKEITPVEFKRDVVTGNQIVPTEAASSPLANYNIYTAKFSAAALGLQSSDGKLNGQKSAELYIRLGTSELTNTNKDSEEASESLNRLVLVQTELMDLE